MVKISILPQARRTLASDPRLPLPLGPFKEKLRAFPGDWLGEPPGSFN